MAEQEQDVDTLKRRGRRRLVGAVALVLLAVIVLPMVFDPEPRNAVPPVSVRVPEPGEGAHDDPEETARRLRAIILDRLAALEALTLDALIDARYRRYRALGAYTEAQRTEVEERPDRSLADRLRDLIDPARRGLAPGIEGWNRDEPPAREEV